MQRGSLRGHRNVRECGSSVGFLSRKVTRCYLDSLNANCGELSTRRRLCREVPNRSRLPVGRLPMNRFVCYTA